MKLKLLAISDTHLGEDCSLLSYPQGRQCLWEALAKLPFDRGDDNRILVEEMILIGDIPDRALSSTAQIITGTNQLVDTIGAILDIKRGVYLPGNHDHTIWKTYEQARLVKEGRPWITKPEGESIFTTKGNMGVYPSHVKALLSLFFGFPCGSSWRAIWDNAKKGKDFDFLIANPLYVTTFENTTKDRVYVFAHGTHFRWDVAGGLRKSWLWGLACKCFADININSGEDLASNDSMADLERKTAPYVDSFWQSSRNNPVVPSDECWYIVRHLLRQLGVESSPRRLAPDVSRFYKQDDLPDATRHGRISNIGDSKSLELFKNFFFNPMLKYLEDYNIPTKKITFVYGDTHAGGWADHLKMDSDLRIYNTGGWVVEQEKIHPPCYIFGVFENGGKLKEFILDVCFNDVEVNGDKIIDLAWQELEHRRSIVAPRVLLICKVIEWVKRIWRIIST